MVRAHGLRDIEAATPPPQQQQQRVVMSGGSGGGSPLPNFHEIMMPKFRFATFIFVMTVLHLCIFVAELIVNFVEYDSFVSKGNRYIGPNSGTLKLMGAGNQGLIRDGDIYRLITPVFLHGDVLHLVHNLGMTTLYCYRMEDAWGFSRTAIVYFLCGFGGCCFSSGVQNVLSVGASGAICGMFTAMLVHYFMIWNSGTEMDKMNRYSRACFLGCISMMMILMGLSSMGRRNSSLLDEDSTDHFGHFGGAITGFCIGLIAPAKVEDPISYFEGSTPRIIAALVLLGFIGGCLAGIFL